MSPILTDPEAIARAGLSMAIEVGGLYARRGVYAVLNDGTTVDGLWKCEKDTPQTLGMLGGVNTANIDQYSFTTLSAIPEGHRKTAIGTDHYDVLHCTRIAGGYQSILTLVEGPRR